MSEIFSFINDQESLIKLCAQFQNSTWLAVDTEFERVSTYYPELCLVQISDGVDTVIVDPIAIDNIEPLIELLYQESITKVLHSAHQDLEIFFNIKGNVPMPLFDTQLAAPLLGHAEGIGYGNLVKEVLKIELEKGYARTNWKQRPLTSKQLEYAANDAIYLGKVYEVFLKELEKINDLSIFNERTANLAKSETYQPDPGTMWKKIFAARKLKGKNLAIVKKLAAWREMTARSKNRPRKWIMPDHVIIDIAKRLPENKTDLLKIDKLSDKIVSQHGDVFLEIVAQA